MGSREKWLYFSYTPRFRNFDKFYHSLVQQPYPLQADEQGLAFFFPEVGLQFLALNSAWEIDEFFKDRSSINDSAFSRALLKADEQRTRAKNAGTVTADTSLLRPVASSVGMVRILLSDAFQRFLQAEVRLCLHGHVHEERADLIGYWHPTRQLHVAGAGSFWRRCPRSSGIDTSALQYWLEIARDHSWVKVHTRHMRKDGGAWEGGAVWPGTGPHEKRTYYTIDLTTL